VKKTKEKPMSSDDSRMLTIRIEGDLDDYIVKVQKILQSERPIGSNKVTKTEAVTVLLTTGRQAFEAKYAKKAKGA
jgi:hypothetical protein